MNESKQASRRISGKPGYLSIILVFLAVLVLLVLNATRSGLWYDESIEYYYSRVTSGPVPCVTDTGSMYERITETFQPPLYNCLMFLWLSVFDSEFGFRLAGILTTLIGGIGFFLALKKLSDYSWSVVGTAIYLLTGQVMLYALECAEYNLMLCTISWTLYFFLCAIMDGKKSSMAGFFLLACLSVYSQYGAVFIILPLYCALIFHFIRQKERIRELLLLSCAALLIAIPLVVFFLLPQLHNQGTVTVSHHPVFRRGNLITDFAYGIYLFFKWLCGGRLPALLLALGTGGAAIAATLSIRKRIPSVLPQLLIISICAWLIYYLASAFSFYGYNAWDGPLGTYNLGGRYALFFVPVLLLFCLGGMYRLFCDLMVKLAGKSLVRGAVLSCLILLAAAYGGFGIHAMIQQGSKNDVREVEKMWMDTGAYEKVTLLHSHSEPCFQFYLTHDDRYQEKYQEKILTSGLWMFYTTEEEVTLKLTEMGLNQLPEFVFVGPNSDFIGSYDAFLSAAEGMGYYAIREYEGIASLILFTKSDPSL